MKKPNIILLLCTVVLLFSCGISDEEKRQQQADLEKKVNTIIGGWEEENKPVEKDSSVANEIVPN